MARPGKNVSVEFESPLPHGLKPATVAGFRFLEANCDKTVPRKYRHYRPAKLVKGKRWYIEYYYRVPSALRAQYGKEWERFKVNENVNRFRDEEYALELQQAVNRALEKGYNPFEHEEIELALNGEETGRDVTIKEALEFYLQKHKEKGLELSTLRRYESICNLIRDYFADKKLLHQPVNRVKTFHIEKLLSEHQKEKGFGNRQYNNIKDYVSSVFSYLKKKKIIQLSPAEGIESKKVLTQKHKYYDSKLFPKITAIIREQDDQLYFAFGRV